MSIENIKKIEEIRLNFEKALKEEDDEVGNELFDQSVEDLENIIKTRDKDILPALFDLFTLPDLDYTGICESLENMIFQYFSPDQILETLNHKLSDLIEFNSDRAKHFAGAFINHKYLEKFRNVLSEVRSIQLKNKLIEECYHWIGKDYPVEIAILKKDIENEEVR